MKMTQRMFQVCIGVVTVLAPTYVGTGDLARGQTIIIDPWPHPPLPRPQPVPIPRPLRRNTPLEVKKHAVEVSIVDGVAVTGIEQVFFNPHDRTVEGTYIFPLEDDVALTQFSMYVNGRQIEGKLLGVEEARRQYESIVAKMRDPALLEYLGTRMFRARIFPINPKSEVRVKLSYTQMLKTGDGLVRYRYPLGTDRSLTQPIEIVSVLVNIESTTPIKSVFSPSHKMAVSRPSDHKASTSYEGKNIFPDKNFELYYALSDKEFGMTVLTYRENDKDGFFLVRIAPPVKTEAKDVLPKDIAFVIDTSGSMAGEKMDQAVSALKFCVSNLNSEDRFNIIPFSHEAISFRDTLVSVTEGNVKAAREFADGLRASGGTNINDALLTALDTIAPLETDRPYLIVFLTDGQPTVGVTDPEEILRNITGGNNGRVRLYVFGIGYDVNTKLLDLLAEQNHGARDYVEPGEDLELTLSSFYRKVAEPVLANPSLSFQDLNVYDLYPARMGDLFAGSELVVAGRYKGEGAKAVELTGTRRGKLERFVYETTFPSEARTHEFLPRLWATRKVGFLLDEIRLHGESKELKDTIVELATKYGIVTPYTAYLVTEPGRVALNRRRGGSVMAEALQANPAFELDEGELLLAIGGLRLHSAANGNPASRRMRKAGVKASRRMTVLRHADAATVAGSLTLVKEGRGTLNEKTCEFVKRIGARTFYRVGERWVDAAYDEKIETRKVELFSERYFKLVRKHPELAKCFALGERVVVVVDDTAYETVLPQE